MEKKYFVYLTENRENGKKYIGQHIGYDDDKYLGSGVLLKRAIEKYGSEKFRRITLEEVTSQVELDIAERNWIEKFDAVKSDDFYNLTDGGTGGNTLKNLTDEQLSERAIKYRNTLNAMTDEERAAISAKRSEGAKRHREQNKNFEADRIAAFKKTVGAKSEEVKRKQYDRIRGANHYCARRVQTPLGIFTLASEAAKAHNVNIQTVLNRCKHETNFHDWRFLND